MIIYPPGIQIGSELMELWPYAVRRILWRGWFCAPNWNAFFHCLLESNFVITVFRGQIEVPLDPFPVNVVGIFMLPITAAHVLHTHPLLGGPKYRDRSLNPPETLPGRRMMIQLIKKTVHDVASVESVLEVLMVLWVCPRLD